MSSFRRARIFLLLLPLLFVLTGGCRRGDWVDVEAGSPARKMAWRTLNAPFFDLWTPDGQKLWAVGAGGIIVHSSDGGAHWQPQKSSTTSTLNSVHGTADGQNLWVAGSGGIVLRSRNGGISWSSSIISENPGLIGVFGSAKELWSLDGQGFRYLSRDGGESWILAQGDQRFRKLIKLFDPGIDGPIRRVLFAADGLQVFAISMSSGSFAHSQDSGRSWRVYKVSEEPFYTMAVASDGSEIWLANMRSIWHGTSPDSGVNWRFEKAASQESVLSLRASFKGKQLWATTHQGGILKWNQSLNAWEKLGPSLARSWEFAAAEKSIVWLIGNNERKGIVAHSTDQGVNWHFQEVEPEPNAVYSTPDGTNLWISHHNASVTRCSPACVKVNVPLLPKIFYPGLGGFGKEVWILAGDKVFLSSDQGETWSSESVPGANLLVASFLHGEERWVLDAQGQLFKSQAGRSEWRRQFLHPWSERFVLADRSIALLGTRSGKELILWTVDSLGGIWRLNATSKKWRQSYSHGCSRSRLDLTSDGQHLWSINSGRRILYSGDSGRYWQADPAFPFMPLSSIAVTSDGASVWAAGSGTVVSGHQSTEYPQVLQARLVSLPHKKARLEVRVLGTPSDVSLKAGNRRDLGLDQLPEVAGYKVSRSTQDPQIWRLEFDPEAPEISLERGEDLFAEVILHTSDFRQAFTIPPLPYEPWWQQPYALPLAGYILWLVFLLILLVLWPASLLRLQRLFGWLNLARLVEVVPYGGFQAKFFLEAAGALPLLARTPRVLDAWVRMQRNVIRQRFEAEKMVHSSRGYVPLPVKIADEFIERPDTRAFSQAFSGKRFILSQIVGTGGAGKTMLAVQVARWAFAGKDEGGLELRPMLPVLIDEDTEDLRAVVKRKLTSWLGGAISDDLLNALLRKQRILVIFDRVSERDSTTREHLRTLHGSQSINSLLVTTRQPLDFEAGSGVIVYPQPLGSETLLHFMTSLLQEPSRSGAFQTMKGQIDLAQRLADLIRLGDEEIPLTPLLARLYVDKAVELAKAEATLKDLPTSIPNVYFDYLRSVNPPDGLSDPDMLRAAEALAELALEKGFVPHEVLRPDAQKALAEAGWKEPGQPDSILQCLRGNGVLQETNVGTEVLLRFTLDPVAEFLAASAHAKRCGESISAWKTLVLKIDQAGPQASGFRLALRLVCEAYGQRLDWACSEAISRLTQESPLP